MDSSAEVSCTASSSEEEAWSLAHSSTSMASVPRPKSGHSSVQRSQLSEGADELSRRSLESPGVPCCVAGASRMPGCMPACAGCARKPGYRCESTAGPYPCGPWANLSSLHVVELRAGCQNCAFHAMQSERTGLTVLQRCRARHEGALRAMPKVDQGVRVACGGKLVKVIGVQGAAQEQKIWALASLRGYAGERFEPLENPRARRAAARQAVPGACKGLSSSRGFGCISNGVHAVRAELDTRPVHTLGIAKAYAGVHACQNRSQEEARAEAGAGVTDGLLPSHQECHWDRRRLPFISGDDLLAI